MSKILKKYSNIILIILIIIISLFYINGCKQNNTNQKRISNLLKYKHTVKQYKTKKRNSVNYNNSIEVTPEDLIAIQDTLLNYIEGLELKIKNVHSTTIITERLRIDTLKIPIYLTDCEFDTTVQVLDPYYNMDITLTNKGLTFNTLEFPNRVGITLADKRLKWWKPKESIVTVTNSNPYMQTDGISTYVFKKKKKLWKRPSVIVSTIGILGGIIGFMLAK